MKIQFKVVIEVPDGFGMTDATMTVKDTYEEAEQAIEVLLQEDDRNEYQIRKVYTKGN